MKLREYLKEDKKSQEETDVEFKKAHKDINKDWDPPKEYKESIDEDTGKTLLIKLKFDNLEDAEKAVKNAFKKARLSTIEKKFVEIRDDKDFKIGEFEIK